MPVPTTVLLYQFEDENENPIAPICPEEAIIDKDGTNLKDKLAGLDINKINNDINAAKQAALADIQATYDGGFTRS